MHPVDFDLSEGIRLWLEHNGYNTDNFSFRFEADGKPLDIIKTNVAVKVGPSFGEDDEYDDEDFDED